MELNRFEIKKLYVQLGRREEETMIGSYSTRATVVRPISNIDTQKAWEEASKLANEGWELVSSVPIISGAPFLGLSTGAGTSFTDGYILLFQKEIQ